MSKIKCRGTLQKLSTTRNGLGTHEKRWRKTQFIKGNIGILLGELEREPLFWAKKYEKFTLKMIKGVRGDTWRARRQEKSKN